MIKKLLIVVLLITSAGVINSYAQAQCTVTLTCIPNGVALGICPDSTQGLPPATKNQPYTVTMSIKIPATYVYMGASLTLTHLALTDVLVDTSTSGTPAYVALSTIGLTYLGSGANTPSGGVAGPSGVTMTKFCFWNAPGTACVIVSGTPNKTGTFKIRIKSKVRVDTGGFGFIWNDAPDNNDYKLLVNQPVGIESLDLAKFDVEQNVPNPFGDKSAIRFSSVNVADVDFKVYNMLGAVVYNNRFKSSKGVNTITIEANSFAPGVYMYSIQNGDATITKRMVVSGK